MYPRVIELGMHDNRSMLSIIHDESAAQAFPGFDALFEAA
jgi:hypothetical protein